MLIEINARKTTQIELQIETEIPQPILSVSLFVKQIVFFLYCNVLRFGKICSKQTTTQRTNRTNEMSKRQ